MQEPEKELFKHPEAFCLMNYECKQCNKTITIWNSRNGVTPFGIDCRWCEGGIMQHVHFGCDKYSPFHLPNIGDLVFADQTEEGYREVIRKRADHFWNQDAYGCQQKYKSVEDMAEQLYDFKEGQPTVYEVTAKDMEENRYEYAGDVMNEMREKIGAIERRMDTVMGVKSLNTTDCSECGETISIMHNTKDGQFCDICFAKWKGDKDEADEEYAENSAAAFIDNLADKVLAEGTFFEDVEIRFVGKDNKELSVMQIKVDAGKKELTLYLEGLDT